MLETCGIFICDIFFVYVIWEVYLENMYKKWSLILKAAKWAIKNKMLPTLTLTP